MPSHKAAHAIGLGHTARAGHRRPVSGAVAALTLLCGTACVSPDLGTASLTAPQPSPAPAPAEPTRSSPDSPGAQPPWVLPWAHHTTPNWLCPDAQWSGLTVQAGAPAEVGYLQKMAACAQGQTRTWLRNNSAIVWVVQSSAPVADPASLMHPVETLKGRSFRAIMANSSSHLQLLAPGEEVFIDSGPTYVRWTIDLPANLAWETHDVMLDQITSFGVGRIEAALHRQGRERAALTQCTLSGLQVGLSAPQLVAPDAVALTDADTHSFLLGVVGAGVQAQKCVAAAKWVHMPTRVLTPNPNLSQKLALSLGDSSTLSKVHTNLSWAARAARVAGQL